MRRIVFINRFYWPEETATAQLLTDLASALASRSYAVEVLTARTQPNLPKAETHAEVAIRRLGPGRKTNSDISGKFFDYLRFLGSVFWHLLWRRQHIDTLVVMTDPPMLGATVWLATMFRQVAVVHWVQDVYPEIAIALGGPRWLRMLEPLRDLAWRRSARCVVPSSSIRVAAASAGVDPARIVKCSNWALPELQPISTERVAAMRDHLGLQGKFIASYSGNLGRAHELELLLGVAEQLRHDPDFLLLFIGRGAQRERLEAIVAERSLPNVRFIDPQPRHVLADTLSVADVHFVTLRPGTEGWVFPSKLYGIVAVGRPVFYVGAHETEIGQTIRERGWGQCFKVDQLEQIAEALRSLKKDANRRQAFAEAIRNHPPVDFTVALEIWMTLLESVQAHPEQPVSAPPR